MSLLYSQAARLVAILAVILFYGFSLLPQASPEERTQLAARFEFERRMLPTIEPAVDRSVRPVHPNLAHISAWISSVGASVALNDLDGDGLANDVCYVNTASDQVIVAPAPGTGERYEPFALAVDGLDYAASTMAPMGCLPADMNEDGQVDLLVYFWGRTPVAYLGAAPKGLPLTSEGQSLSPLSYQALEIVPGAERWNTNAATFADVDGDGHVDLVIGNYFADGARILDATASDEAHMQHSMSRAFNAGRNRILLWSAATTGAQPFVQYVEAENVLDEQVAHGWTLAVGAADLDGDLLPELYFANDFGPDRLLHNRSQPGQVRLEKLAGRRNLTTPKSRVLGADSFKGMGAEFADLNADGFFDILVSNIAAEYALEESHFAFISTGEPGRMASGEAPYVDRGELLGLSRSGWGWDIKSDDFDNDGLLEVVQATGFVKGTVNRWPELHELAMGNDELLRYPASWPTFQPGDDLSGHQHNPFYVLGADGRYHDLAAELHLDALQVSRGIATADVDGDGDLDFAVANQWEPSAFYQNNCPACGAFLALRLLLPVDGDGEKSTRVYPGHLGVETRGRAAIGATATVQTPGWTAPTCASGWWQWPFWRTKF